MELIKNKSFGGERPLFGAHDVRLEDITITDGESGIWKKPGVWNVEEFDPDPFMEQLNKQGLPWHEVFDGDLEIG